MMLGSVWWCKSPVGFNRIRHVWLLPLLLPIGIVNAFIIVWIRFHIAPFVPDLSLDLHRGFFDQLYRIAILSLLGPIAEELLFRGWLWERLKVYWNVVAVMAFTCTTFLSMHWFAYGWIKLPSIAAIALTLTLVRWYCGSVRASMIMHVFWNAVGAVIYGGA